MTGPSDLASLREVIRAFGLSARKGLGQHFLLDLNLTRRIVRAAGPLAGRSVIEIGPGPGGLTRALLESEARTVIAIERDARCVAALAELSRAYPDRLRIIEADALAIDPATLGDAPRRIVANLPYNIATPLLIGWIGALPRLEGLTLMFQKEVAARLVARPGDGAYGRLSVLVGFVAEAKALFDVPARAFTPPPKVVSSVVDIRPRPRPLHDVALSDLERVTAAAFGQRRKMLRQSLKRLGVPPGELLERAGIAATARAEELDLEQFAALAAALSAADRGATTDPRAAP